MATQINRTQVSNRALNGALIFFCEDCASEETYCKNHCDECTYTYPKKYCKWHTPCRVCEKGNSVLTEITNLTDPICEGCKDKIQCLCASAFDFADKEWIQNSANSPCDLCLLNYYTHIF